jgi:hypothetical protein
VARSAAAWARSHSRAAACEGESLGALVLAGIDLRPQEGPVEIAAGGGNRVQGRGGVRLQLEGEERARALFELVGSEDARPVQEAAVRQAEDLGHLQLGGGVRRGGEQAAGGLAGHLAGGVVRQPATDLPGQPIELGGLVPLHLLAPPLVHQLESAPAVAALPGEARRLGQGARTQRRARIVAEQLGEGILRHQDVAAGRRAVAQDIEPPVLQHPVGIARREQAVFGEPHLLTGVGVEAGEETGEGALGAAVCGERRQDLEGVRAVLLAHRGGSSGVEERSAV